MSCKNAALLSAPFARHVQPPTLQIQYEDPDENSIEVGSIYEIDHDELPLRTPMQLRSIRVVIVSEKTMDNITVKYPSLEPLTKHFMMSNSRVSETFPSLDEKFTMDLKLASKVLYREVSSQEFADNMAFKSFWMVDNGDVFISKNNLTSALKCSRMLSVQRHAKFLDKRTDFPAPVDVADEIEEKEHIVKVKKEEEVSDHNCEVEDVQETSTTLKRKRFSFRTKKKESPYLRAIIKSESKSEKRWSIQRYKSAEKSLLEVMKAKGAVFGKPILRPALREAARKKIGDTGLLDHLLKHMAGKVAPGETDRFRRRHNAEGAMEYWLENAELDQIRKEAGVEDPYWIPPPGWKPGDCPTSSSIKRDMDEMVTKIMTQFDEKLENWKQQLFADLSDFMRKMQQESQQNSYLQI